MLWSFTLASCWRKHVPMLYLVRVWWRWVLPSLWKACWETQSAPLSTGSPAPSGERLVLISSKHPLWRNWCVSTLSGVRTSTSTFREMRRRQNQRSRPLNCNECSPNDPWFYYSQSITMLPVSVTYCGCHCATCCYHHPVQMYCSYKEKKRWLLTQCFFNRSTSSITAEKSLTKPMYSLPFGKKVLLNHRQIHLNMLMVQLNTVNILFCIFLMWLFSSFIFRVDNHTSSWESKFKTSSFQLLNKLPVCRKKMNLLYH